MDRQRDKTSPARDAAEADGKGRSRRRLPAWTKALLAASAVLIVAGAACRGYYGLRAPAKRPAATQRQRPLGIAPKGLLPVEPPDAAAPASQPGQADGDEPGDWSWGVSRLGVGFFAGFCIAYALRAFLRICLIVIGVVVLVLVGLQYAGVIQVNLAAAEGFYQSAGRWLAAQTATLRDFIGGYIPSTGTLGLGLFAGFKRR